MNTSVQKTLSAREKSQHLIIPIIGKDEMNLIEFPFGPITHTTGKTMVIEHEVWDRDLKREVVRQLIITGADAFGLPRPIDDQVLVGMKALTYEAGSQSREVTFSRYELCRALGWVPDGRAYQRLEESFDRIAGTTLKFKDAWWDKGENEWRSQTFHLIERVNLCSRAELDRRRASSGQTAQKLCSFVWSETVWKSFQDGFIKTLDMRLFRRIASGRRREVPLRLFRILDKRFHKRMTARMRLKRLCVGTLGLSSSYSPSQMYRILERAADWLIACGYLASIQIIGRRLARNSEIAFFKSRHGQGSATTSRQSVTSQDDRRIDLSGRSAHDRYREWLVARGEPELAEMEARALAAGFGSELERKLVLEARAEGRSVLESGSLRQVYVARYLRQAKTDATNSG